MAGFPEPVAEEPSMSTHLRLARTILTIAVLAAIALAAEAGKRWIDWS